MKVRKKPVVVDAFKLTDEWFDGDHPNSQHVTGFITNPKTRTVTIPALEGKIATFSTILIHAHIGDWIIKGVEGEYYPCKPDIFEQTYEFVEDKSLVPEPSSLLELCQNILELARHGDYSDENAAQGLDEGRVMAATMMADYEKQLKNFKDITIN